MMERIDESKQVLSVQELRAKRVAVENAICDLYKETNLTILDNYINNNHEWHVLNNIQEFCVKALQVSIS